MFLLSTFYSRVKHCQSAKGCLLDAYRNTKTLYLSVGIRLLEREPRNTKKNTDCSIVYSNNIGNDDLEKLLKLEKL